jgi:Secretion system C-terminal sorting domain/Haemagglutinin repeat
MKKLLSLIFVLVSLTVFSQTQNIEWEQTYGGTSLEMLHSTVSTSDGGYLLGGYTESNDGDIQSGNQGGFDYWVVKINSTGTIEWEQTYGGSNYDEIHSTIPTSDGGYLLGGGTSSNDGDIQSGNHGERDSWLVKINSTGTIDWEQTYGGSSDESIYSIISTSDGGYLLGGGTSSTDGDIQSGNHGEVDCWLVKINSTGAIEWEQTYGGSSSDALTTIIPTSDSAYLLGGCTMSNDGDIQSGIHGSYDWWVVKINSTGTIEWEQTYGGSSGESFSSIISTFDGGYLLGGWTGSNNGDIQSGNHGYWDYWVVKINSTGTIEWEQTYGGIENDDISSTISTYDGGYLLGGETSSTDGDIQSGNHGDNDSWLVKINSTGTIEWEQTYGGSSGESIMSIIPTSDGGFLLGGFTCSNDGDIQSGNHGYSDYWVVKISGSEGIYESYDEKIKIYPNPVKDKLFVNLENAQSNVDKMLLFNSTGKLVFSSEGTEIKSKIIEISTLDYNTGLYNLNLYTEEGVIQRKIVIVR